VTRLGSGTRPRHSLGEDIFGGPPQRPLESSSLPHLGTATDRPALGGTRRLEKSRRGCQGPGPGRDADDDPKSAWLPAPPPQRERTRSAIGTVVGTAAHSAGGSFPYPAKNAITRRGWLGRGENVTATTLTSSISTVYMKTIAHMARNLHVSSHDNYSVVGVLTHGSAYESACYLTQIVMQKEHEDLY